MGVSGFAIDVPCAENAVVWILISQRVCQTGQRYECMRICTLSVSFAGCCLMLHISHQVAMRDHLSKQFDALSQERQDVEGTRFWHQIISNVTDSFEDRR